MANTIIRILMEKDCKKKAKEMQGRGIYLWNDDLAGLSMWWEPIAQVDDEWEKEASIFMDNNPWVIGKIREVQAEMRRFIKAESEMEDVLTKKLAARACSENEHFIFYWRAAR